MGETVWGILFHPFAMLWAGQLLHFLKLLKDEELLGPGKGQGFWDFIRAHPYSIAFSIVAGFCAYGFLFNTNQLNVASAFTAGYMADSVVNAFTSKTIKKIENSE